MKRWAWPLAALAVIAVLAVTVLAYRHPAVMIQLSEQVWSCFG
jgi:hypothetical protein